MARIPTPEDLGMRMPRAGAMPASVGRVEAPQTSGLGKVGKLLREESERIDNQQLSEAEVQLQLGLLAEEDRYKTDDDIDTIEDRYGAGLMDQLGKAAAVIDSGPLRQQFTERNLVTIEKNKMRMAGNVFNRKKDRERGYMANAFAEIVRGTVDMEKGAQGLSTGDQLAQGIVAIQLSTDSMVERGIMTQEEAQAAVRSAQNDMALGKLKSMPPEQQLEALSEEWVKNVPPEVRGRLEKEATDQLNDNLAFSEAAELQDMEYEQGIRVLQERHAGDWDAYNRARTRYVQMKQDQEVGKQMQQEMLYEEHFGDVFYGNKNISDIGDIDKYGMSPAQMDNLRRAEEAAIKRAAGLDVRQYSDPAIVAELNRMIAEGQEVKARTYWSENYAKLDTSDFRYYDARLSPSKNSAPEFKPIRTARQLLTEFKDQHPVDDAQSKAIWDRLEAEVRTHYEETGKNMPKDEQNKIIESEFFKVVQTPAADRAVAWWDEEEFVYNMDEPEREAYNGVTTIIRGALGGTREKAAETFSKMSLDQRQRIINIRAARPNWSDSQVLREALQ